MKPKTFKITLTFILNAFGGAASGLITKHLHLSGGADSVFIIYFCVLVVAPISFFLAREITNICFSE
jgi:hypothetical protein